MEMVGATFKYSRKGKSGDNRRYSTSHQNNNCSWNPEVWLMLSRKQTIPLFSWGGKNKDKVCSWQEMLYSTRSGRVSNSPEVDTHENGRGGWRRGGEEQRCLRRRRHGDLVEWSFQTTRVNPTTKQSWPITWKLSLINLPPRWCFKNKL